MEAGLHVRFMEEQTIHFERTAPVSVSDMPWWHGLSNVNHMYPKSSRM